MAIRIDVALTAINNLPIPVGSYGRVEASFDDKDNARLTLNIYESEQAYLNGDPYIDVKEFRRGDNYKLSDADVTALAPALTYLQNILISLKDTQTDTTGLFVAIP